MPKQPSQSFLVVADTNALFSKDPTQIVGEGFTALWAECLKLAKLRLALPEVVRGERLYQILCVAQRSRESAERNIETIAKVSASEAMRLPEIIEIRQAVENRFDEWAKSMGVAVVPVPCNQINWQRVVNDAIWRVSPFTPPSGDKDTEKGFRDCLIVETLNELIRSNTGEQVVFITKDRLLRDATIARFEPGVFAAYEDLGGFLSYLKLTHEQAEKARNELIQRIIQKAPGVFYAADNPQCVYTKFSIGSRIIQEFSAQLNVLPQPELENTEAEFEGFSPASEEKIFIDSTRYEHGLAKAAWEWKTRVRLLRLFRPQPPARGAGMDSPQGNAWEKVLELLGEIVRVARFDVHWTARCDEQGNFSQLKLVALKPLPQTQEIGFFKFKYGFKVNES
jgi:hypothetical protein